MTGRHSKGGVAGPAHDRGRGGVPVEGVAARNRRQVVDVTEMSPREIRARMEYLQDRHVVQVEQACDDLAASVDRFRAGLVALRERVVTKASAAAPVVAGGAAVVATTLVLVRTGRRRRPGRGGRRRQCGRDAVRSARGRPWTHRSHGSCSA